MCCILNLMLVVLNIAVILIGLGVMVVGILVEKILGENIGQFVTTEFSLNIWLIVIGVVIAVIGFLGAFGVIMKNKCMLYCYAIIVFLLVAGQVALVIFAYVATETVDAIATDAMEDFFTLKDPVIVNISLAIQYEFSCCGVESFKDWFTGDLHYENDYGLKLPPTCCKVDYQDCSKHSETLEDMESHLDEVNQQGCYDKIVSEVKPFMEYILYASIALIVVQILCIIQSCVAAQRNNRKRSSYY